MGMFVEVESVDKNCKVIINLDHITEIAPLAAGGCAIFFNDAAAVGGVRSVKVKDSFSQFQQFAMQTVSSEDIANRIAAINKAAGVGEPQETTAETPQPKRGRPAKPAFSIPKFDGSVPSDE